MLSLYTTDCSTPHRENVITPMVTHRFSRTFACAHLREAFVLSTISSSKVSIVSRLRSTIQCLAIMGNLWHALLTSRISSSPRNEISLGENHDRRILFSYRYSCPNNSFSQLWWRSNDYFSCDNGRIGSISFETFGSLDRSVQSHRYT